MDKTPPTVEPLDLEAMMDGTVLVAATVELEIPGSEIPGWVDAWDDEREISEEEAEAAVRETVEANLPGLFDYAVDLPYVSVEISE